MGCGPLIVVAIMVFLIGRIVLPSTGRSGGSRSVSTDAPSETPSPSSVNTDMGTAASGQPTPSTPLSRQVDISVQNLIVKRVPVGNSTRFRYFFATKNNGDTPFTGNVNIMLHTKTSGITREDFKCNLPPGIQGVDYIDARTGPERFHADSAYVEFSYVATVGPAIVAKGRGTITTKFEDLSQ